MSVLAEIGDATLDEVHDLDVNLSEDGVLSVTASWRYAVRPNGQTVNQLTPDLVALPFILAGHLPKRGKRYLDTQATCRDIKARIDGRQYQYLFTATFSSKNATDSETGTDEDPLLDKPDIDWSGSIVSRATSKDRAGKPLLNTAGDPVIAAFDDNVLSCTVRVNVPEFPTWLLGYRNSTNDADIVVDGIPIAANVARLVLPGGFISKWQNRNDIYYRTLTYELHMDEQDFHYGRPISEGLREKILLQGGPAAELRNILNDDGTEITDPVPLDSDGARIPVPTPDNAHLLTQKLYYEKDFSVIPGITV